MVKIGAEAGSSENSQQVNYLGDQPEYKPQIELSKYLAKLGVQYKTQADDLYGGVDNAKNYGSGGFGYNPFEAFDPTGNPPPPDGVVDPRTGKPPEWMDTPQTGTKGGTKGGTKAPAPPGNSMTATAPVTTPPPPGTSMTAAPASTGPTPEELLAQWTAGKKR
jgi:hypothetical protein